MDWLPTLGDRPGPVYETIVEALGADVASGRLHRGERLPPHLALAKARASLTLGAGLAAAAFRLRRIQPRAVVGFGGYPTVPPLLAAWLLRIPTVLHEQNAVMGRANRFLSPRVNVIACGFPGLKGVDQAKARVTGNPVRPSVIDAAALPDIVRAILRAIGCTPREAARHAEAAARHAAAHSR